MHDEEAKFQSWNFEVIREQHQQQSFDRQIKQILLFHSMFARGNWNSKLEEWHDQWSLQVLISLESSLSFSLLVLVGG